MKLNGGKELEPPYSEEEVNNVLTEKQITFTDQLLGSALYNYLTKVSRRIYAGSSYMNIAFDLNEFPMKSEQEKICIPYDTTSLWEDDIYYKDDEPEVADKHLKYEADELDKCMVTISQGEGISYHIYLGLGYHYGSIWYCYDHNNWYKEDISFQDYLIKHFKMG